MINFKRFLFEKTLSPKVFADAIERFSDEAQLGFELEMWVNHESDFFVGKAPYVNIRVLADLEDFQAIFVITSEVRGDIRDKFQDWKSDNGGNWSRYFKEEFGEGINGANSFIDTYDLEPQFGWKENQVSVYSEPSSETSEGIVPWKPIATEMALELGNRIGEKVHIGYTGNLHDWVIVSDESIEGPGAGAGLEIISPPRMVGDAMESLQDCFRFMDKHELITNSTTGLHINLSIPDLKERLDPLKLVLFIGEDHVLKQFQREGNKYSATHTADILDSITHYGVAPKGSDIVKFARETLTTQKYRTVNLSKLKAGYLEFRSAGNSGYQSDWRKISDTIGRFLTVLEIACDPAAERNLYLKKVVQVFGKAVSRGEPMGDTVYDLVRKTAGLMTYHNLEDLLKEKEISKTLAATYIRGIMVRVGKEIQRKGYQPDETMRAAWKFFYNKFAKRIPDLAGALADEKLYNGEQELLDLFKRTFRVK